MGSAVDGEGRVWKEGSSVLVETKADETSWTSGPVDRLVLEKGDEKRQDGLGLEGDLGAESLEDQGHCNLTEERRLGELHDGRCEGTERRKVELCLEVFSSASVSGPWKDDHLEESKGPFAEALAPPAGQEEGVDGGLDEALKDPLEVRRLDGQGFEELRAENGTSFLEEDGVDGVDDDCFVLALSTPQGTSCFSDPLLEDLDDEKQLVRSDLGQTQRRLVDRHHRLCLFYWRRH